MSREHESLPNPILSHEQQLAELYRTWGIFDLLGRTIDELPPSWLQILNIARNLYLGNPIPGIAMTETLKSLTQTQTRLKQGIRQVPRTVQVPVTEPTTEIEIERIERLTDLETVIPTDSALQVIAPDLFALKAVTKQLRVNQPQEPKTTFQEEERLVPEVVTYLEKGRSARQSVYVLLDVSHSMDDNYKLIFAKAIILAYLAKAHEEDARLYLSCFAGNVSNLHSPERDKGFPGLAEYVLSLRTYSYTDIALALETAIEHIEKLHPSARWEGKAETELFLISDCASYTNIPRIPHHITLHTLHLEGGYERHERLIDYYARLDEIRGQSKTFIEINTNSLGLPAGMKDSWLLAAEARHLEEDLGKMGPGDVAKDKGFQDRVERLRQMATAYRKIYDMGQYDTDFLKLKKLEQRARDLKGEVLMQKMKEALKNLKSRLSSMRKQSLTGRLQGMQGGGTSSSFSLFPFDFRTKPKKITPRTLRK